MQAISGNNPTTGKMLGRMLMKGGIDTPDAPVAEDNHNSDAPDSTNTNGDDLMSGAPVDENKALDAKLAKVDKTQAMVQLKNQLGNKSASVQSDFVMSLLNGLELKSAAKQRLKMKIKQDLK